MPWIEVILVDRPAHRLIVIVKGHPFMIAAKLIGKGCPEPAGANDRNAASIQIRNHAFFIITSKSVIPAQAGIQKILCSIGKQ
jgi:hypothetical protein